MKAERVLEYVLPVVVACAVLAFWEWAVVAFEFTHFVLPAPSAIWTAFVEHGEALAAAAWVTVRLTVFAFVLATIVGAGVAILFSQSRLVSLALYPYAVTLQVTPIVAIAPLILIWVGLDNAETAVLILATIVAFFPILANTTAGLLSADRQLHELFDLYGATRWQRLWRLQLPAALPSMLTGIKIAGGLALIGTVVAEFAAGSGTSTGLAWTIIEGGNRLQTAKVFAALVILSAIGIAIYWALTWLEWRLLRNWHETALLK